MFRPGFGKGDRNLKSVSREHDSIVSTSNGAKHAADRNQNHCANCRDEDADNVDLI